jgi:beta-xylosidase
MTADPERPPRQTMHLKSAALILTAASALAAEPSDSPWVADLGNGQYRNPVLAADYSDPDVTRVGDDFYLTASSFTNVPGLPILHSRDLVNWTLIGHALPRLQPGAHFAIPRRGGGVWAPAIRHHNGKFYIYYPDPDFGVFVITASDPRGPWSEPVLVDSSRGVIDPSPFWDEDGKAWLVVAYARSRAGFNNVLKLKPMSPDGMRLLDEGNVIIDGNALPLARTTNGPMPWAPIEGPKLYKREGWYYIFAPAGGVKMGWQTVFRSRNIAGPYEYRNVLDQGKTEINGPHQGAWVTTAQGESWFVHFQDTDTFGRRVHLQPMTWKRGWPVIGTDTNDDGIGEPVSTYRKPKVRQAVPVAVPMMNDEFTQQLSLAWQWHANPQDDWMDLSAAPGFLRLKSISGPASLYEMGNVLTQKFPAPSFVAGTKLRFAPLREGERAGLAVVGTHYGWIGLRKDADAVRLVQNDVVLKDAVEGDVYLRARVEPVTVSVAPPDKPHWPSELKNVHAQIRFSYSTDGVRFTDIDQPPLTIDPGRWVGATIGLFASAPAGTPSYVATSVGYADFDYFHVARDL